MSATPLLVFADDWGRHPSSCQHLVRQLLPTHPTTWVNTIGTRTPRLDTATLRRAAGKLRQWFGRSAQSTATSLPDGLTVLNPRMWPWLTRRGDRWLNRRLLVGQLAARIQSPATVAITTLPIVADLMGRLPVSRWIYYCVDDFSAWPGLDRRTMSAMEEIVVKKADVVIAASTNLQERLAGLGRKAHLLTHGVDVDFWRGADAAVPGLDPLERPLVVFWGVVDRRMDTEFVEGLARTMEHGTIVLVGPEQGSDPALARLPRLQRLGPMPFAALPALARAAAVLIMPYVDAPVTRAMQPLKLKEYLATGKPVVVRDLPANRAWAAALDSATTAAVFAQLVVERLRTGVPHEQLRAREQLARESWSAKAAEFAQLAGIE